MALIDQQAAIDALNEQIEQCNKALGSFGISPKDEYAIKVERASLKAYKDQLENLPPAPAIPLAWIESYIQTCEIFDLRANGIPVGKIIKTMVKIWEQENPGGRKGGDNGKT